MNLPAMKLYVVPGFPNAMFDDTGGYIHRDLGMSENGVYPQL